jgi:hypothetical protein
MKNHHQAIPSSIESYRKSTDGQLYVNHVRKQCQCGKPVTAKQLTQYGACAACHQKSKESAVVE